VEKVRKAEGVETKDGLKRWRRQSGGDEGV
jgi:hypothetical protein